MVDNEVVDIDLEEVLSGMEGKGPVDFADSESVVPGTYSVLIRDVKAVQRHIVPNNGDPFDITEAQFDLEIIDSQYAGWSRAHRLGIGPHSVTGEMTDRAFQASVKRVLGSSLYESDIATQGDVLGQYKAAFDLLKGSKAKVRFGRSNTRQNDESAPTYPQGGFMHIEANTGGSGGGAARTGGPVL
tara:strand:- start:2362 stop:2919 length:558 start_codon:yes stop_codon:yes gene_type:complete